MARPPSAAANEFFKAWGDTDVAEAARLIDICLEAGVNLFDTADAYSDGPVGGDPRARRSGATRSGADFHQGHFSQAKGPNDLGSSRYHLTRALEASLRRLGTDYIDIYHLHGFDALTPIEEVLDTLEYFRARRQGALHRLLQLLRLAPDEVAGGRRRYGWPRYVAHQVYYSLVGREYEWELMPLGIDQKVGAMVWSPLGWGG